MRRRPGCCTIPGVGKRTAESIDRRDRRRHEPVPDRRAPGVVGRVVPGQHESAGKRRSGQGPQRQRGAAHRDVRSGLVRRAAPATPTWRRSIRRFKRRMGKKNEGKAIFAVAHTMIVIIWHSSTTTPTTTNSAPTTSTVATTPTPASAT